MATPWMSTTILVIILALSETVRCQPTDTDETAPAGAVSSGSSIFTATASNALIYRFGCYNYDAIDADTSTELPNNFPGTCLAYCNRQTLYTQYIALQNEKCNCLNTGTNTSEGSSGCSQTCPGHSSHYCGNEGRNVASMYKIEYKQALSNSSSTSRLCRSYSCNSGFTEEDCGTSRPVFCTKDISLGENCSIPDASMNNGTWEDGLNNICPETWDSMQYLISSIMTCSNCNLGSVIYWIGAFGQWAPPKNCTPSAEELTMMTSNTGVIQDSNTVFFNCSGVNITRHCMANGTWTGRQPVCTLDTTTTTTKQTKVGTSKSSVTTKSVTTSTTAHTVGTPVRYVTTQHVTTSTTARAVATHAGSVRTKTIPASTTDRTVATPADSTTTKQISTSTTAHTGGSDGSKSKIFIYVGAAIGVIVLVILLVILLCIYKKKKNKSKISPAEDTIESKHEVVDEISDTNQAAMKPFQKTQMNVPPELHVDDQHRWNKELEYFPKLQNFTDTNQVPMKPFQKTQIAAPPEANANDQLALEAELTKPFEDRGSINGTNPDENSETQKKKKKKKKKKRKHKKLENNEHDTDRQHHEHSDKDFNEIVEQADDVNHDSKFGYFPPVRGSERVLDNIQQSIHGDIRYDKDDFSGYFHTKLNDDPPEVDDDLYNFS